MAASAGHPVFLCDAFEGAAERAQARIADLGKRAAQGRLTAEEAAQISARIRPVGAAADLPACVVVIEAIAEDLDAKSALRGTRSHPAGHDNPGHQHLESVDQCHRAGRDASLAVLGPHFFNPPPAMKLAEVIRGETTTQAALDAATALVVSWGKVAVRCASTPGFIVNRVARPFYGEAQRMLQEGVADAATIDACLRSAGFRMGPLELTDLGHRPGRQPRGRHPRSGNCTPDPARGMPPRRSNRGLVAAGHLGRKSGQGVYTYAADGTATDNVPDEAKVAELLDSPVLTNPVARTLAMLVNEAVDLVDRGEAGSGDVDLGDDVGHGLPQGPDRLGPRDRLPHRARPAARARRGLPGRPLSPSSPALEKIS